MTTIKPPKVQKIKVGDRIRIVNPEFFVRCGYDASINSEVKRLEAEFFDDFRQLYEKVGGVSERGHDKIMKAIAFEKLHEKIKTGSERKVFTYKADNMVDHITDVKKVQYVKTGIYNCGHYSGMEDDYDPAYLSYEKVHRILHTYTWKGDESEEHGYVLFDRIEDVHVEKVEK